MIILCRILGETFLFGSIIIIELSPENYLGKIIINLCYQATVNAVTLSLQGLVYNTKLNWISVEFISHSNRILSRFFTLKQT